MSRPFETAQIILQKKQNLEITKIESLKEISMVYGKAN